jgi:hypothetical protein
MKIHFLLGESTGAPRLTACGLMQSGATVIDGNNRWKETSCSKCMRSAAWKAAGDVEEKAAEKAAMGFLPIVATDAKARMRRIMYPRGEVDQLRSFVEWCAERAREAHAAGDCNVLLTIADDADSLLREVNAAKAGEPS